MGKENSKAFLAENPDIAQEIEARLRPALGLPGDETEETEAEASTEASTEAPTKEGAAV